MTGLRNMTIRERRCEPRDNAAVDEPTFIEIRHTFGPVRKSVYKVVEHNERGTSFLVPVSDGYFRSGYPLEYALIKPDLTKTERYGEVRYHHPYNDGQGSAFFKVGVENRRRSHRKPLQFHIRPERYNLASAARNQAIYFAHGGREYQFPLQDISRYSAAFYCSEDQALGLTVSAALDSVEIVYGSQTVFEGTVIVTRRELASDGSRYRIVIEPRNAAFNVEIIETEESLTSVARSIEYLIVTTKKHREIDKSFKSVVSDMRLFLEEYRRILDLPVAARLSMESDDERRFLDELNETFYPELNSFVVELDDIVNGLELNETDHGLYKSYFQTNFHPLLMSAPFCHRTYFKPLGYPGDYEMMRMIKEAEYKGPSLFFKLVNRAMVSNPLSVANRNRVAVMAKRIASLVESSDREQVRLLSLASGPAFEIQKLVEEMPHIADRIHITLLDQEVEALKYSQDNIYMKRIMYNCRIQVELIHDSIGSFLKDVYRNRLETSRFDMIYIFGLFDYFDDRACLFCLDNCAKLLREGGRLLVSNYSLDGHKHRAFTEYALEWYMVYRSAEEMRSLGEMVSFPCRVSVDEDATSIIKFLELGPEGAP